MSNVFSNHHSGAESESPLVNSITPPVLPEAKEPQGQPQLYNRWTQPWGFSASLLYGIGAFVGSQLLAGVAISAFLALLGKSQSQISTWSNTIFGNFIFVCLAEVAVAIFIVGFVRMRRGSLAQLGLTKFRMHYILIALLGIAAYLGLYVLFATLLSFVSSGVNYNQQQQLGFDHPIGAAQLIMTAISLVLLPPFAEELTFRGFMFAGLRRKLPFIWAALLTSVLFAVGHLEFGSGAPLLWVAAIDTFALSLVMTFIRERTGSIWPTIMMHMLKNGTAFVFLYLIK